MISFRFVIVLSFMDSCCSICSSFLCRIGSRIGFFQLLFESVSNVANLCRHRNCDIGILYIHCRVFCRLEKPNNFIFLRKFHDFDAVDLDILHNHRFQPDPIGYVYSTQVIYLCTSRTSLFDPLKNVHPMSGVVPHTNQITNFKF